MAVTNSAHALLQRDVSALILFLPNILGTAVILVFGWVLALIVERVVATTLRRVGFDDLAVRTGMIDDLSSVGIRMEPARLLGRLVFWMILTGAVVEAADTLELPVLSRSIGAFVAFLPHVVIAATIALAGIIVGDIIGRGTAGAMSRSGVLYHDITGGFIRTAIIVIAMLIALQQLTIESAFFFEIFLVAFTSIALSFAIAVGWGARSFAADSLAGRFVEKQFVIGERIRFRNVNGTIERFDALSTIVRTDEGRRLTIPNSLITGSIVETYDQMNAPPIEEL